MPLLPGCVLLQGEPALRVASRSAWHDLTLLPGFVLLQGEPALRVASRSAWHDRRRFLVRSGPLGR
jgi:hypothetical protein